MSYVRKLLLGVLLVAAAGASAQPTGNDENWTTELNIPIETAYRSGPGKIQSETVSGDLFRPKLEGRLPAAVIINSSGGVQGHIELYYARVLASHGVAALVVDSYLPRGVVDTVADQSRVWASRHYSDAPAAFRWLARQPYVDPARIVVMGLSRGGKAALDMAIEDDRKHLLATDVRFAAHVAIAPGCNWQQRNARSTGAPIFFVLSELDDFTPIAPCLEYYERIRKAGNSATRLAVYPGVYHAQEWIGGVQTIQAERGNACSFYFDSEWRNFDRTAGKPVSGDGWAYAKSRCVDTGPVTIGGDARTRDQMVEDILQFLRDSDIVRDDAARRLVPDCAAMKETRRNCVRARNGWVGDLVAVARALRYGSPDIAVDLPGAARLFRLAADRGHPQAKWELALLLLRDDLGVARDTKAATALLTDSARVGESAAMNLLGVVARDGLGRDKDDAEAALWFRRAAILRNPYGLANLGRFYWHGRGSLVQDDKEAVRLWRIALTFANPWATYFLAEANEFGRGLNRNLQEARRLYRVAAEQTREPQAAILARQSLLRLGDDAPSRPK